MSLWSRLPILAILVVLSFTRLTGSANAESLKGFPGNLLENPKFFPIAVWLQDPIKAEEYKRLGINLYVGLWQGPTSEQLARLKAAGMPAFSELNDVGLTDPNNDMIVGWMMRDEPDNGQKIPGSNRHGPPIPPQEMIGRYHKIRSEDSTRPVMINLGQGVAWDEWHGRGPRTNHPEDYEEYVKAGDIVTFNIYPITTKHPAIRGRLDFLAKGVDRLVTWTHGQKPVWSVIGASRIGSLTALPTGDDIRRQVWLSIIHGASGIMYFAHQARPRFVEAGLLQHEELRDALTKINARIKDLAPVLNSKSKATLVSNPSGNGPVHNNIATLVKTDNCFVYIFAGSRSKFSSTGVFQVNFDAEGREIDVLDENRSILLEKGQFEDRFGPYAVHLYKIQHKKKGCPLAKG